MPGVRRFACEIPGRSKEWAPGREAPEEMKHWFQILLEIDILLSIFIAVAFNHERGPRTPFLLAVAVLEGILFLLGVFYFWGL